MLISVTWMRWFVCTTTACIRCNALRGHFISPSQVLYTAIGFGPFLFICVYLLLTCCQRGNSQHPATLPPAASWCATERVTSWINMVLYKGMSVGRRDEIDSLHVFEKKGLQRAESQGHGVQMKNKSAFTTTASFFQLECLTVFKTCSGEPRCGSCCYSEITQILFVALPSKSSNVFFLTSESIRGELCCQHCQNKQQWLLKFVIYLEKRLYPNLKGPWSCASVCRHDPC